MDERLETLRGWFKQVWKFDKTVRITSETFTQQVDLLKRSDLDLEFELLEPGKPARYLVFG